MHTPDYRTRHTLKKDERLKSQKLIDILFKSGKILNLYPIRVIYYTAPDWVIPNHQVLFAVPKRKCKRAVFRNQLKRRMREAYRLNKHVLPCPKATNLYFLIAYVYVGDLNLGGFNTIQKKVVKALEYIANQSCFSIKTTS